jgi:hypothetical protein
MVRAHAICVRSCFSVPLLAGCGLGFCASPSSPRKICSASARFVSGRPILPEPSKGRWNRDGPSPATHSAPRRAFDKTFPALKSAGRVKRLQRPAAAPCTSTQRARRRAGFTPLSAGAARNGSSPCPPFGRRAPVQHATIGPAVGPKISAPRRKYLTNAGKGPTGVARRPGGWEFFTLTVIWELEDSHCNFRIVDLPSHAKPSRYAYSGPISTQVLALYCHLRFNLLSRSSPSINILSSGLVAGELHRKSTE